MGKNEKYKGQRNHAGEKGLSEWPQTLEESHIGPLVRIVIIKKKERKKTEEKYYKLLSEFQWLFGTNREI